MIGKAAEDDGNKGDNDTHWLVSLPDELLEELCCFLPHPADAGRLRQTCKAMRTFSEAGFAAEHFHWAMVVRQDWSAVRAVCDRYGWHSPSKWPRKQHGPCLTTLQLGFTAAIRSGDLEGLSSFLGPNAFLPFPDRQTWRLRVGLTVWSCFGHTSHPDNRSVPAHWAPVVRKIVIYSPIWWPTALNLPQSVLQSWRWTDVLDAISAATPSERAAMLGEADGDDGDDDLPPGETDNRLLCACALGDEAAVRRLLQGSGPPPGLPMMMLFGNLSDAVIDTAVGVAVHRDDISVWHALLSNEQVRDACRRRAALDDAFVDGALSAQAYRIITAMRETPFIYDALRESARSKVAMLSPDLTWGDFVRLGVAAARRVPAALGFVGLVMAVLLGMASDAHDRTRIGGAAASVVMYLIGGGVLFAGMALGVCFYKIKN
ncbi:hypothetical protein BC828DRAFT_395151 [Blastocladiella britannica]|nr:hypothetical protein BC828DRAFT_395151 [Blastocladiella britannica]